MMDGVKSTVEWLTPDLIHELLFVDMEKDIRPESKCVVDELAPKNLRSAKSLMSAVDPNVSLSALGEDLVLNWIRICDEKGQDAVIQDYPKRCCNSAAYFNARLPISTTIKLLLDIMKAVVTVEDDKTEATFAEITFFESDILEYLGGYSIKKALKKFHTSDAHIIINQLCNDRPQGDFIPLMERKVGVLKYPSEDYLRFLHHTYLKFSVEAKKESKNIDFNKVSKEVFSGQYFSSFVFLVDATLDSGTSEEIIFYLVSLVIRMLSYSFAEKLFSRLHSKSTKQSCGLRGDLKRQIVH